MTKNMIDHMQVYHLRIPLTRPYHLSFKELTEFDLILVKIISGNLTGYGESVPLYGYSDESLEDVWGRIAEWKMQLEGSDARMALEHLAPVQASFPFSTTPVITAIETMLEPLAFEQNIEFPLLGTLLSETKDEIRTDLDHLLSKGYRTIKVKVGLDVKKDIDKVRFVQDLVQNQALLRLDANQAYRYSDARTFVSAIDPGNIELFEQPFPKQDWAAMKELTACSPIPLMLDESIHDEADLDRVIADRSAQFVKFKLMKAGSLDRLKRLIGKATEQGLKVILGNGVAGEIGNLHEIVVAHSMLKNAGEMNGFLKQSQQLLIHPIPVSEGRVCIPRGYRMVIDEERLTQSIIRRI